jgi:hypothetical protein
MRGGWVLVPITPFKLTDIQRNEIERLFPGQSTGLCDFIERWLTREPALRDPYPHKPGKLKKELQRLYLQIKRAATTLERIDKDNEGEFIDQEFLVNTGSTWLWELARKSETTAPFKPCSGTAWMLAEIAKAVKSREESVTSKKGEKPDHYDLLIMDLASYFGERIPSIKPSASEGSPFCELIAYVFRDVLAVKTKRQGYRELENPKQQGDRELENPKRRIKRALKFWKERYQQNKQS